MRQLLPWCSGAVGALLSAAVVVLRAGLPSSAAGLVWPAALPGLAGTGRGAAGRPGASP